MKLNQAIRDLEMQLQWFPQYCLNKAPIIADKMEKLKIVALLRHFGLNMGQHWGR
jgi:hypothetical protein